MSVIGRISEMTGFQPTFSFSRAFDDVKTAVVATKVCVLNGFVAFLRVGTDL